MAKAILELEMPESCWQCPCIQDRTETYRWCGAVGGDCPNPPYEKRRDDCPLKPVEKGGDEMLTKRQLEDAAECLTRFHERTCGQCSCNKFRYGYVGSYGCTENAAQTALAYRELAEKRGDMLKRLEWSGQKGNYIADECPVCRNARYQGHKPDCEIAALLKESEVEEE